MWSPQRRSRVGSGVDFDPFTVALLEATKAPSPLDGKDDVGGVAAVAPHGSSPTRPATCTVSRSAGWRRWRLSDLLLFRSSSDGGRVNSSTCPSRGRAQQPPTVTIKASAAKRKDMGKGFPCIRMVNNTRLNFDAFHTVRVFCKAGGEDYSLTVRNGTACLAPTNPRDEYQHWVKDMRHSTRVRDEEGYPAFALVNKVTGEALKHSTGQGHPVKLVPYNPDYQDESVLWTESRDVGNGFRCVRMVNNIYLNFDALHGDKWHGGVRDGTNVVLWKWCEGDNQRWKIQPYY